MTPFPRRAPILVSIPLAAVCLAALSILAPSPAQSSEPVPSQPSADAPAIVPGKVLLALSPGPQRSAALSRAVQLAGGKIERRLARDKYAVLALPVGLSPQQTARRLHSLPGVAAAAPVYRRRLFITIPNDSYFSPSQWSLHNTGQVVPFDVTPPAAGTPDADVDAPEAWDLTTGSASVIVAVIDTGIAEANPDLAPNLWTNPGEIPGDGIDNDGNGYIDDVHGFNFSAQTANFTDLHGHGTSCAGIIGARGNDATGIAGLNWNVSIMPLKSFSDKGQANDPELIEAIEYAVDHGARIINASWGDSYYSPVMYQAVRAATERGVLFVAAAGNEGHNLAEHPAYPASSPLPGQLSVGASDFRDRWASFSNYDDAAVDVIAPGLYVYTTRPTGFAFVSGTSFSTPHVAGAAALMLALDPSLTPDQLRNRLIAAIDSRASLDRRSSAGGRLSVYRALTIAAADTTPPAPVNDLQVDWIGTTGFRLAFTSSGDDAAAGTPLLYDVRISSATLDDATFHYAERVRGVGKPAAAGTRHSFFATGLDPDITYHFRLRALDDAGNLSPLSNEIVATTAGRRILFADDMDHGPALWTVSGSFALTSETARSGLWCWTESPGDNYARGQVATLTSPPIDLSGVSNPWVRFYHQHIFEDVATRMDTGGALQVSTDGIYFTTLARYFDSAHPWRRAFVSLADYAGQPALQIRFRFHSDLFATLADGWHIDDVEVYEPIVPIPDPPDFVVEAYQPFGLNVAPLYAETGGAWFYSVSKAVDASLRSFHARYNLLDAVRDSTARFTPIFPADGVYEVFAIWGISANANHVRYTIRHAKGQSTAYLDQNGNANPHQWFTLGSHPFQQGRSVDRGSVTVDDMTITGLPVPAGEGRVYADAIRFIYRGPIEWDASAWMLH